MSISNEKKDYKIYQDALTDEVLKKLPLTFKHLQKGNKANTQNLSRHGKSGFHQNDEYTLHGYHKPVSKILLDGILEKTNENNQ